jgi:di/tricarboxylate transporter
MPMMTLTFTILGITLILFIWGKLRADAVALLSMVSLYAFGILTVKETFSGFSNTTVVMIAALFIVGEAMSKTGVTSWLGNKIVLWSRNNANKLLIMLILGTAIISGFVSNTGTVASLIPVAIAAAWRLKTTASKMLIPLAFAANTGGLLTLTGTPPNIIANQALLDAGYDSFHFFEYAYIGIPLLISIVLYMRFIGIKILPNNSSNKTEDIDQSIETLEDSYQIYEGFWKVRIRPNSSAVGKKLSTLQLDSEMGISVMKIIPSEKNAKNLFDVLRFKPKETDSLLEENRTLQMNDELILNCSEKRVQRFIDKYNVAAKKIEGDIAFIKENVLSDEVGLSELIVAPRSSYRGKKINVGRFAEKYNVQVIALNRYNKRIRGREFVLQEGDTLLVRAKWEDIKAIQDESKDFLIVGHPEELAKEVGKISSKGIIAIFAMTFMVTLLVAGIFSSAIVVMMTAMILVAGGCINMNQSYRSINWNVVIIIAGMIPMGVALQKTGAAKLIADSMVGFLGQMHPTFFLAGVFLITTTLSQVMSNSATSILMAPIIISAALELGYSPIPFMMVLAVSASTAFLTPFGTTTNMMVMNAGNYTFKDYAKVGAGLLFIFFVISIILIPLIWPYA